MDERQINPTFHYSSTISSSLGGAANSLQIPVCSEISSTPTIPNSEERDNSIIDRYKSEKWRPTMPTTTLFYPAGTSTASNSATFTSTDNDSDNKILTTNQPMIHGNTIDERDVIIKQEEKILGDEIANVNCFEFIRPYEFDCSSQPSSFSSGTNITTMSHRIHVNPSILLSKHRANYSGPGTPMPNLSTDYDYSRQLTNYTKAIKIPTVAPRRRKRSRKNICNDSDKTQSEINEHFASVHPKEFAKLILEAQERDNCGSERKKKCLKEQIQMERNPMFNERKDKKVDARIWLNAKAKLMAQAQADITKLFPSSSSSTTRTTQSSDLTPQLSCRQFIDRATSPINFPGGEQTIKSETRDIALSPIRFIEPQVKHYRSHPDVASRMNLSLASSQPIESANRTKILNRLFKSKHSCGKCIVMSREMVEPICPICHAKNGRILKQSI